MMRNPLFAQQVEEKGGNLVVDDSLVDNGAAFGAIKGRSVILVIYTEFVRVGRSKNLLGFSFIQLFFFHFYTLQK